MVSVTISAFLTINFMIFYLLFGFSLLHFVSFGIFGLLFGKPMFQLFLRLLEGKVLDPNGQYISTSSELCPSSSVARLQPKAAYIEA